MVCSFLLLKSELLFIWNGVHSRLEEEEEVCLGKEQASKIQSRQTGDRQVEGTQAGEYKRRREESRRQKARRKEEAMRRNEVNRRDEVKWREEASREET